MPRGDKDAYTDKQKRKARHIEDGYEDRGIGHAEAERRAWATVNKDSGGGNKSGSGRGKPDTRAASRKGGASQSAEARSAAAKKGWETRRRKKRLGQVPVWGNPGPAKVRVQIDGCSWTAAFAGMELFPMT